MQIKPIGPRLTRARRLAGLSKSELARRVGVSRPTLVGWETGPGHAASPGWQYVVAIADVCAVDPAWLLTGHGRPHQVSSQADRRFTAREVQLLCKLTRLPRPVRKVIEEEIEVLSERLPDDREIDQE